MLTDSKTEKKSIVSLSLLMLLPFMLGHYVSYIFRSINAVLAPYLYESVHISSGDLGLLTSAYFFAFALAQLPVGLALDRYGPRKVQMLLLVVAAFGSLLFGLGEHFTALVMARLLIGLGLSACFMASVKAAATWFDKSSLPTINSILLATGGLGAMTATWPVQYALANVAWPNIFFAMAVVLLLVAVVIATLVPKDSNISAVTSTLVTSNYLSEVFRMSGFRNACSLLLIPHAAAFGMQGLWLGRWLSDGAGLDDQSVSVYLFVGMAAVVIGSLLTGNIAQRLTRRGISVIDVAGWGACIFLAIQLFATFASPTSIPVLSVLFAFTGTIAGLDYTIVAQSVPSNLAGRASTCLNLMIFVGAFVLQWGFGLIVGEWQPNAQQHYPEVAYQVALGIIALLQVPGILHWVMTKRRTDKKRETTSTKAIASH